MNIKGKTAIVTGAASGIGRATVIELAKHGCTPVLVDIQEDKLATALDEVRPHAPSTSAETCDISSAEQVRRTVEAVKERHGNINILVNNAAIMSSHLFKNMSEDQFRAHMEINFFGLVALTRAVLPIMQQQGEGVILNVASVGAKLVVPGTSAYSASKAAVHAFTEALYLEMKDSGIHVGIITPGGIRTSILDSDSTDLGAYYRSQLKTSPDVIAKGIRQAIEKERYETVLPAISKLLLASHAHFGGLLRKALVKRMRPYFD